jgi:hypothetical protein
MTATRPSLPILATFFAVAAVLVIAAASPILEIATRVVA